VAESEHGSERRFFARNRQRGAGDWSRLIERLGLTTRFGTPTAHMMAADGVKRWLTSVRSSFRTVSGRFVTP
jgi:hypothetical protein